MKILLIDPSPETAKVAALSFKLSWPDAKIIAVEDGEQGIVLLETEFPDLVIMALELPDIDSLEVIRCIRLFSDVPIIVLSEQQNEMSTAMALEMGGDDCIIKPLHPLDLLARVRAILRRTGTLLSHEWMERPFTLSSIHVDFARHEVLLDGHPVHLTPTEYSVLHQLVRNAGRLVTIQSLKQHVWGSDVSVDSGTVRKCICRLRSKLEDDPSGEEIILTEWGIGYKLAKTRETVQAGSK